MQHLRGLADEEFPTRRASDVTLNMQPDALSRHLKSKEHSPSAIWMPEGSRVDHILPLPQAGSPLGTGP